MGDGLQYVPVRRHVADGPLAQPSAAQPEYVAGGGGDGERYTLATMCLMQLGM